MPPTVPQCPRCSYDLSGQVSSWRDACPVNGICPECGLGFGWYSILIDAGRLGPNWCVEYALSRIPLAILSTLGRILTPWRLWGPLAMHHQVRWKRLAAFSPLATIALGLVLYSIALLRIGFSPTYSWMFSRTGTLAGGGFVRSFDEFLSSAFRQVSWSGETRSYQLQFAGAWPLLPYLVVAIGPVCFAVLPITIRRAKVTSSHVLRVAMYSLPLAPITVIFLHLADFSVALWRFAATGFAGRFDPRIPALDSAARVTVLFCLTVFVFLIWWLIVCERYLRLSQPRAVAISVVTIATCAAILAITFITPVQMMQDLIGR